ncbi:angiopoietin-2-like [Mya arenaria]|uniref:angiopoietin-2-like n=1 Tax=Mya arenaria TaxID=6604 RepID=UPI0022E1E9CD|nr:angiopoietin-2-like [Mya arenaria]
MRLNAEMKFLVNLCAVASIVCFVLSEDMKEELTFNYEEKVLEMVLKDNKEIMNENSGIENNYKSVQDVKQLIKLLINNTEENKSELKNLFAKHDSRIENNYKRVQDVKLLIQSLINNTEEHDSNFVGGGWSDWESWGSCSVACGEGFQTRVRRCDNPTPSSHGRYCHGDAKEWRMCDGAQTKVTDCLDIYRKCPSSPDGVYRVNLWKSKTAISVYCDMTTSNGGWTVFQNRYDGSEEFYLDLKAYTEGFGKTSAEFWLGLRYIKELADQGNTTLRMEVGAADGSEAYEEWPEFQLGAAPGYKLHVGGNGTGTAGRGTLS